jgi:hypothetical protein
MYRTELHFNAISVIESLGLGEPKTGRDLYDSVVFPATLTLDGRTSVVGSKKWARGPIGTVAIYITSLLRTRDDLRITAIILQRRTDAKRRRIRI